MRNLIIYSLFVLALANPIVSKANNLLIKDDAIENISSNVLQHFGYTFYRAKDVKWSINETYQKATFTLNDKVTYAIYDLNNTFLVATQVATIDELPEKSKISLEKDYSNYKTVHILKIVARPTNYELEDDTNNYWIEMTSSTESLVAVTRPKSELNIVRKEKK
ncbi:hypothetical protein [Pedobacter alpinus]|uniref:Beta-lactamase-inhibitor-like PepSY-like domain-containing protein n=1 Tax=Pedobacter alpinus TaxID=1590643 RepID=A0ABW5TPB5_9SPHI